ncbi:hypothetical protein PVL29_006429 [Vitis rotundifolia]|uniref:Uncharacterized protein n=1 Tax=Vitis rotundifolia TaxID=103349 RepID=A0AA39A582_VITRO|nr:hypothetical protein PVL29_006429 [Vitis rotundifolia]
MPPKGRGSKAIVQGSSSRTSKGAHAKTSINGIIFNIFLKKFCRDLYIKVFHQRSLVLEKKLYLEYFLDTTIPALFVELGWLSLTNFTGTACAPFVQMFYSNIIEHDLDESYLKSSLFGIVVKVTPEVIAKVLGILLVEELFGKIKGALGSKKKVCHTSAKRKFGENDSNSDVDSSVLAQLCARFDALDEKISAQSTLLSEQISQLQSHMERGFSLIDGQMLCNMD